MTVVTKFASFDRPAQLLMINQFGINLGFYMLMPYLAGYLAGPLGLAAWARQLPKGRVLQGVSVLFGGVLLLFALSRSLPLSLAILVATGFIMIVNTATTNTLLQTLAPDHMRGRVMSVFTFAFVGMGPIGALQAGFFADRFGAPATLIGGGIVCTLFAAAVFQRVPELRELR